MSEQLNHGSGGDTRQTFIPFDSFSGQSSLRETKLWDELRREGELDIVRIIYQHIDEGGMILIPNSLVLSEMGYQLDWDEACTLAAYETAAFQLKHPLLLATPYFAPLHRLWRTLQLATGFVPDGDTVLIGSGFTVPEAVAIKILPPSSSDIMKLLEIDTYDNYRRQFTDDNMHESSLSDQSFAKGTVIGVEPKETVYPYIPYLREVYNYPPDRFKFLSMTIGEALEAKAIGGNIRHFIWNHCDPRIISSYFTELPNEKAELQIQDDIRQIFSKLQAISAPSSTLLLTVGTGNQSNPAELVWRKKLIELAAEVFKEPELSATNVISRDTSNHFLFNKSKLDGCEAFVFTEF